MSKSLLFRRLIGGQSMAAAGGVLHAPQAIRSDLFLAPGAPVKMLPHYGGEAEQQLQLHFQQAQQQQLLQMQMQHLQQAVIQIPQQQQQG